MNPATVDIDLKVIGDCERHWETELLWYWTSIGRVGNPTDLFRNFLSAGATHKRIRKSLEDWNIDNIDIEI